MYAYMRRVLSVGCVCMILTYTHTYPALITLTSRNRRRSMKRERSMKHKHTLPQEPITQQTFTALGRSIVTHLHIPTLPASGRLYTFSITPSFEIAFYAPEYLSSLEIERFSRVIASGLLPTA